MPASADEKPELIYIDVSPWSRRLTWAFHTTGVPYKRTLYNPFSDEYWLRWKLGVWRGKLTIPVLCTKEGVIRESYSIAEWINKHEGTASLIPAGHEAEVKEYDGLADTITCYCRNKTFELMAADTGSRTAFRNKVMPVLAIVGAVPVLGWLLDAYNRRWLQGALKKYAAEGASATEEKTLAALHKVAGALEGGRQTLLKGGFSYADIAVAIALDHMVLAKDPRSPAVAAAMDKLAPWSNATFDKHYPQRKESK